MKKDHLQCVRLHSQLSRDACGPWTTVGHTWYSTQESFFPLVIIEWDFRITRIGLGVPHYRVGVQGYLLVRMDTSPASRGALLILDMHAFHAKGSGKGSQEAKAKERHLSETQIATR